MFDPTLYFVTPPVGDDLDSWKGLVNEAVLGGVTMVQVRDKNSSTRKIMETIKSIQPFLRERGIPLLINDRVDIAHVLALDGVHLGQSDLSVAEARSLLGPHAIVGISLENREQMEKIKGADYVAASPVLPSNTKNTLSAWGLPGLTSLRQEVSLPLIAIGGIREHNLASIVQLGIEGIAVISAIASSPCPREAAARLLRKCKEAKNEL